MLSPQHMLIHVELYHRMGAPVAAEAERSMFIEAMCGEASSDLLCSSLEKGLCRGDSCVTCARARMCTQEC